MIEMLRFLGRKLSNHLEIKYMVFQFGRSVFIIFENVFELGDTSLPLYFKNEIEYIYD